MKLTQMNDAQIAALTPAQVTQIVFTGLENYKGRSQLAIVLGGEPQMMDDRAAKAADLYYRGNAEKLIVSGGVLWEHGGSDVTEADYMKRLLTEAGIPESAILCDRNSSTTKENMVCSTFEILRQLKSYPIRDITIVTSQFHLRRSLLLGKNYLPREYRIHGAAMEKEFCCSERWMESELSRSWVLREPKLIRNCIRRGYGEDFEVL